MYDAAGSFSRLQASVFPMTDTKQSPRPPILVVEDDAAIRRIVLAQLKALGYEARAAANGPAALALLDEGFRPGLLFTDLGMPGGMDGFELADAVSGRMPQIRVLFTSGSGEPDEDAAGPRRHILAKPYPRAALAAKLDEMWASAPYRG